MMLANHNRNKDIPFLVSRIFLSYCVFISIVIIFNKYNNDRLSSFLIVNSSALVAMGVLCFRLKKEIGFSLGKIIFSGYFIKLFIGYLFWCFYIFPDYFSNSNSQFKFDHFEYLISESWMRQIAEQRIADGFLSIPTDFFWLPHFSIHYFMSNLYYSGSFNPFDIAVQNSLFSIYAAVIVLGMSKYLGATSRQMKYALIFAVYQPFSFISSMIFRDIVGQFFVALGGYFALKSWNKKFVVSAFFLALASFSMLIQRSLYFFFPVLVYTVNSILNSKNKVLSYIFLAILVVALISLSQQLSLTEGMSSYEENISSAALWIFLPINILRVLIGPIPWSTWFDFTDNTIFLIGNYLQSVVTIALIILSWQALRSVHMLSADQRRNYLLLATLFAFFVFAALGTADVHQVYMSTGAIFLIPVATKIATNKSYLNLLFKVLAGFIVFNVVIVASGLSGAGVGDLLR